MRQKGARQRGIRMGLQISLKLIGQSLRLLFIRGSCPAALSFNMVHDKHWPYTRKSHPADQQSFKASPHCHALPSLSFPRAALTSLPRDGRQPPRRSLRVLGGQCFGKQHHGTAGWCQWIKPAAMAEISTLCSGSAST